MCVCVGRYKWHTCMCRIHKDAQQNKYSIGVYIYIMSRKCMHPINFKHTAFSTTSNIKRHHP